MPERELSEIARSTQTQDENEVVAYGPPTAEEAVEERLQYANEKLGVFYDITRADQQSPAKKFILELNLPRLERIFPSNEIQRVIESISALPDDVDRSVFIDTVRSSIEPLLRAETIDPVAREKIEALREEKKITFTDSETGQALACTLRELGQDLALQDSSTVHPRDLVLEVSWPTQLEGPSGLKAIRKIFRDIARYMQEHDTIQAVTGVSWMMSHPIAQRLGFEIRPDVEFPVNQKIGSADMGNKARQGRYSTQDISPEEVLFGIISRQDFLRRFGDT